VVLLSACHSPEELRQHYLDEARGQCTTFGFKPDTPEFAQCVQAEFSRQEDARQAARDRLRNLSEEHRSRSCLVGSGLVACY